jgi:hypothetical protein
MRLIENDFPERSLASVLDKPKYGFKTGKSSFISIPKLTKGRRAKMKRLTADDRECMIKMRAVPDDFDNVPTLHSPISTPSSFSVDFPTLTDHMTQAPIVDIMIEKENGDHLSLTGLSPAFSHVGFAPGGLMGTPDVTDRHYPSHFSSLVSAGSWTSNMFDRQNSEALRYGRQHVWPLQLRETLSLGSKSLQPTSTISWGGDITQNMVVAGCPPPGIHPGDGKESPPERRELDDRTAAELKKVKRKFEEVDKWELELEFEDVAE